MDEEKNEDSAFAKEIPSEDSEEILPDEAFEDAPDELGPLTREEDFIQEPELEDIGMESEEEGDGEDTEL
jgi:hypothetical protein